MLKGYLTQCERDDLLINNSIMLNALVGQVYRGLNKSKDLRSAQRKTIQIVEYIQSRPKTNYDK